MAKLESEYKKILLKLSGEALAGDAGFGIDPKVLDRMSLEIKQIIQTLHFQTQKLHQQ